jgi:hypothetical protein
LVSLPLPLWGFFPAAFTHGTTQQTDATKDTTDQGAVNQKSKKGQGMTMAIQDKDREAGADCSSRFDKHRFNKRRFGQPSFDKPTLDKPSVERPRFDKTLAAYVAAASAAGIGLLGPEAAEAKILYTPADITITTSSPAAIDLNHDGVTDFSIGFHEVSNSLFLGVAPDVKGNEVRQTQRIGAAAAFSGAHIGPGGDFAAKSGGYSWLMMAGVGASGGSTFTGPWAGVTNRYLGLRFVINGETHYGWARLTVGAQDREGSVVLTGYAYETSANKGIIAGDTSGNSPVSRGSVGGPGVAEAPATLGLLARGSDGLPMWRAIWRRSEEKAS